MHGTGQLEKHVTGKKQCCKDTGMKQRNETIQHNSIFHRMNFKFKAE